MTTIWTQWYGVVDMVLYCIAIPLTLNSQITECCTQATHPLHQRIVLLAGLISVNSEVREVPAHGSVQCFTGASLRTTTWTCLFKVGPHDTERFPCITVPNIVTSGQFFSGEGKAALLTWKTLYWHCLSANSCTVACLFPLMVSGFPSLLLSLVSWFFVVSCWCSCFPAFLLSYLACFPAFQFPLNWSVVKPGLAFHGFTWKVEIAMRAIVCMKHLDLPVISRENANHTNSHTFTSLAETEALKLLKLPRKGTAPSKGVFRSGRWRGRILPSTLCYIHVQVTLYAESLSRHHWLCHTCSESSKPMNVGRCFSPKQRACLSGHDWRSEPLCGNCIDLIDENDGWSVFLCDSEHFSHLQESRSFTRLFHVISCPNRSNAQQISSHSRHQLGPFSQIFLDQFTSDLRGQSSKESKESKESNTNSKWCTVPDALRSWQLGERLQKSHLRRPQWQHRTWNAWNVWNVWNQARRHEDIGPESLADLKSTLQIPMP